MIVDARDLLGKDDYRQGIRKIKKAVKIRQEYYLKEKTKESSVLVLSSYAELFDIWSQIWFDVDMKIDYNFQIDINQRLFEYKAISIILHLANLDTERSQQWNDLAVKMMDSHIKKHGCRLPVYKGYYFNNCSVYQSFCADNPPSGLYGSQAISYELYCTECQRNVLDPICIHNKDDECVRILNIVPDHLGIVKNPEEQGTGISVLAMPIKSFLEELNPKIQQFYEESENELDIVCSFCKNFDLSIDELQVEDWLLKRGCNLSWILVFLKDFDISKTIYDDKQFIEENFKNIIENLNGRSYISGKFKFP